MEENKQESKVPFKEAKFLINKDGSRSDKHIFLLIITIPIIFICCLVACFWAFKEMPLPEMASKLLHALLDKWMWIAGMLIGGQCVDNYDFLRFFKNKKD